MFGCLSIVPFLLPNYLSFTFIEKKQRKQLANLISRFAHFAFSSILSISNAICSFIVLFVCRRSLDFSTQKMRKIAIAIKKERSAKERAKENV